MDEPQQLSAHRCERGILAGSRNDARLEYRKSRRPRVFRLIGKEAASIEPLGDPQRIEPEEQCLGLRLEPVQLDRAIVRLEPAERGLTSGTISTARVAEGCCEYWEVFEQFDGF